ncbi:MAG: ATP synthase F0 subunit B [Bacilli bacterium]|nr:ATP synthase F0 subunit B [Bacilli bacterium]
MINGSSPIDPESILPNIIPTFWPFITQLLAFIILFVVVFFLFYKPVKKLLAKRNEFVKNNIDQAKANEVKSEALLKEADEKLNASYREAKTVIKQAKVDAENVRANILARAKDEAKNEMLRAQENIAEEVKRSEAAIHREMVDIAFSASEKILAREVNKKDNVKRVNAFIHDLKEDNKSA